MFDYSRLEERRKVLEEQIRFLKKKVETEKDTDLFENELQEAEEMLRMVNVELSNSLKQLR